MDKYISTLALAFGVCLGAYITGYNTCQCEPETVVVPEESKPDIGALPE